jgi:hypothetical protein
VIRVLQLAFGSSLKRALGLGETVEEKIARCKIAVPKGNVGMGPDFLLRYLDGSFEAACPLGGKAS